MIPDILSNKPSEFLAHALADLRKVESDENYTVNMNAWHRSPYQVGNGKCEVCLAGSILAKSSKLPLTTDYIKMSFDSNLFAKMCAIDRFSKGNIYEALRQYPGSVPSQLPLAVCVIRYDIFPEQFKRDIENIIELLQKAGI